MLCDQPERDAIARYYDLRSFNEMQLREIERHKWIESEKAGRDLGDDAAFDWIRKHAVAFREAYSSFMRWDRPAVGG